MQRIPRIDVDLGRGQASAVSSEFELVDRMCRIRRIVDRGSDAPQMQVDGDLVATDRLVTWVAHRALGFGLRGEFSDRRLSEMRRSHELRYGRLIRRLCEGNEEQRRNAENQTR